MATPAHILIVNESSVIRNILSQLLQAAGYSLSIAKTGSEAVRAIRKCRPDLILLDRVISDGDGIYVLKQIQRMPSARGIPVLIMSSCDDPAEIVEALEAGATDYILKPFSPAVLQAKVAASLRIILLQKDADDKNDHDKNDHDKNGPDEVQTGETTLHETSVDEKTVTVPARILLAEDSVCNQRLLSFQLTKAGAKVTVAGDGKLAVHLAMKAKAEQNLFDLILMDIDMPVLNGDEAVRLLRQQEYSGPIVALTAHNQPEQLAYFLECGCDDFLVKPCSPAELLDVVSRFCTPVEMANC